MLYYTRTLALPTANSFALLTNDGEGNAASPIQLPSGMSAIKSILVGLASSITAVASTGVNMIVELSGNGVMGDAVFVVGSIDDGATDTAKQLKLAGAIDVDIPVNPKGGELKISVSPTGVDTGTVETAITIGVQ